MSHDQTQDRHITTGNTPDSGDNVERKRTSSVALFRAYYGINRRTFPLSRRAAALDAARLTLKVRRLR